MIFANNVSHGTMRYRKKFCFFPVSCVQTHQKTGEVVWLGFVEIIETYVNNGDSRGWNGYIIRPEGRIPDSWQYVKQNLLQSNGQSNLSPLEMSSKLNFKQTIKSNQAQRKFTK